jgi:hypothetical protein
LHLGSSLGGAGEIRYFHISYLMTSALFFQFVCSDNLSSLPSIQSSICLSIHLCNAPFKNFKNVLCTKSYDRFFWSKIGPHHWVYNVMIEINFLS